MLGYAFMGKAHSRALRGAAASSTRRSLPQLVSICGPRPRRRERGRARATAGARSSPTGASRWPTTASQLFVERRPERAPRRADDRGRAGRQARALREAARRSTRPSRTRCGAPPRTRASSTCAASTTASCRRSAAARELVERRRRSASSSTSGRATCSRGAGTRRPTSGASTARRPGRARSATSARTSIDLARYLVGEIASVSAQSVRTFVPGREVDDAFVATVEFETARSARSRPRGSRSAASTRTPSRSTARAGSIAFDLERFDELLVSRRRRRTASSTSPATGGRPATALGWGDTFTLEYAHLLRRDRRRGSRRPARRDVRGRLPRRRGLRRDPALGREREKREDRVPMKTSLGIWAFGPMVDALRSRRLPAAVGRRADARTRCAAPSTGLGDLIDGYEFHYPQELSADNLDAVRDALDGHDIYCLASGLHLDPLFGKGGLQLAGRRASATRRSRAALEARRLRRRARRALHHLARDRGLQLPVPDAVRREPGRASSTAIGAGRRSGPPSAG